MTANAMVSDKEACLAAGMNDHIGKPIDLDTLCTTIVRYCKPAQLPPPAASPQAAEANAPAPGTPSAPSELTRALQRMGGNAALYLNMANSFGPTALSLHDQLQGHIQRDETADAARVLHTLKGIARTMGAMALGDYVEQEEKRIKNSGTLASPALARDALQPLIEHHCEAALQFAQDLNNGPKRASITSVTQDGSAAREDAGQMLDELNQLLEGRNMRALALFGDFKERFGQNLAVPTGELEKQLDKLDFRQAQMALKTLRESLA
jgi:HPt (histidine-containing phosphotransfer) domain-containing protein